MPADHRLWPFRQMVDEVLKSLSGRFAKLYSHTRRPSIPPEKLLRVLLLQVLYTVRSERLLLEQLDYNLLFRWFVGLNMDDPIWDATVFSENPERLLKGEVDEAFFEQVLRLARQKDLLSDEHFTVDGTLIEAWAGQKRFQKKEESSTPPSDDPGNPRVDFHGEKRSNLTHQSRTDPEARLYKKGPGKEPKLSYQGQVLMENRNGSVTQTRLTQATGTAERETALEMSEQIPDRDTRRVTLGADKGYDTQDFVAELRQLKVTLHLTQNNTNRASAIDSRSTRHPGYAISQRKRKRVEEIFGWIKTGGLMRQTRHRGLQRVGWMFTFTAAVYNLVRICNLQAVVS